MARGEAACCRSARQDLGGGEQRCLGILFSVRLCSIHIVEGEAIMMLMMMMMMMRMMKQRQLMTGDYMHGICAARTMILYQSQTLLIIHLIFCDEDVQ